MHNENGTTRHPVLTAPAVQLVHDSMGSDLDDTIWENWQRVDRSCQAMRGFILWDAWAAGYSSAQLATLLDLSQRYVSRMIAYGAIVEQMIADGSPWDTLPTERKCREYLTDAREVVSVTEGIPVNELCKSQCSMGKVVTETIKSLEGAGTASTLPSTGEDVHEPEKHPRQQNNEFIKAGKSGRQTIARFNRKLKETTDHLGTWSAWSEDAGPEETEMVLGYCKTIRNRLGAIMDELSSLNLEGQGKI